MDKLDKSQRSQQKLNRKRVKKLIDHLLTSPVNLTLTVESFDCLTFAQALKFYLEQYQSEQHSIRNVMVANSLKTDLSLPLDTNELENRVNSLRCISEINTDKSAYHVFKVC